jgi:hypothetical protein
MNRVTRVGAATALAATALVAAAAPAFAECVSQTNRFPDFADVAPTASTVVIGTVIATGPDNEGSEGRFTVRIDDAIRGEAQATLEIEFLYSGLPLRGSEACRDSAYLSARAGDVIALALDGSLNGREGVNTAAWIEGQPSEWDPGVRVMSRAKVISAAKALPATDTETVASAPTSTVPAAAGVLVLLGLGALYLIHRQRARRRLS